MPGEKGKIGAVSKKAVLFKNALARCGLWGSAAVLLVMCVSFSAQADVAQGRAAYLAGNHRQALRELEPLASAGDPEAQLLIGSLYLHGHGVRRDPERAITYITSAAQHGRVEAQTLLGFIYYYGTGYAPDDKIRDFGKSVEWLTQAASGGDSFAQYLLSQLYESGVGTSPDRAKALEWSQKAAEKGNAGARVLTGYLLVRDFPSAANLIEAYTQFDKAAAVGYPGAGDNRAQMKTLLVANDLWDTALNAPVSPDKVGGGRELDRVYAQAKAKPRDPQLRLAYANLLRAANAPDKAAAEYCATLILKPDDITAQTQLVQLGASNCPALRVANGSWLSASNTTSSTNVTPTAAASTIATSSESSLTEPKKDWTIRIGAGGVYAPDFEGSNRHRPAAAPIFDVNWKDRVLLTTRSDLYIADLSPQLSFNALNTQMFTLGVRAGYDFGRKSDYYIEGLDDIDPYLKLGAYGIIKVDNFKVDVGFDHDVMGSTDGGVLDVGLGYSFKFPTRTAFDVRVGSRFATESWMESYYGVSVAESLRSGMPFYDAEAEFKDISLSGNLTQEITDHWSLLAYARIMRLIGDADESPVSHSEMQGSGGLGVAYTF